jgi:tetratricopeptide (TPR) repeat protein
MDERGTKICQRRLDQYSGILSSIGRTQSARDLLRHARTLRHKGQFDEALKLLNEALCQAETEGDKRTEAQALGALGINSFMGKDYEQAEQYLKKAVKLHAQLGSANLGECVNYLIRTYKKLHRINEARQVIFEVQPMLLKDEERDKLQGLLAWLDGKN